MSWTVLLGSVLLLWALFDLFSGEVWLHRAFRRSKEPWSYWSILMLWFAVAISCFYW